MRLRALNLVAVGPFEGVRIDLSGGHHGLHLIHGPNEAGKTSALRALRCLLFGFPHRAGEVGFRFQGDRLRVGAVLERGDGTTIEVVRRKGQKNTLRGGDDAAVVDEAEMSRLLGGLDGDGFAQLFGIDHAGLRQAGEQIRSGNGRFGELLFSAAAGLQGLREIQRSLDDRLEGLFKPRGQNPRINRTIDEVKESLQTLKKASLPCDEWQAHDLALADARTRAQRLEAELATRRAERGRLERIRSALPLVGRHVELRVELDAMADVPRLSEGFEAEARASCDALERAQREREGSARQLEELTAELSSFEVPEALLASMEEVEALRGRLGEHHKARADRPKLAEFKAAREHRARELLQELGRARELSEAEGLRLRADESLAIQALGNRRGELAARAEAAAQAIDRHDRAIARLERDLEAMTATPDVAALAQVVRQVRKAGDLEDQRQAARGELKQREQALGRAMKAVREGPATLEALEDLAVPLEATVERFELEWAQACAARDRVGDKLESQRSVVRELEAELRVLDAEREAPTEGALEAARRERDRGWDLVRAAWEKGEEVGQAAAFVAAQAPGRGLAEAYERSVARSDDLADRLRREADRVARRVQCVERLDQARGRFAELEGERALLETARASLDASWRDVLQGLGLSMRTPRELRGWLDQRSKALALGEQARAARTELERLEEVIAGHRRRLDEALRAAGVEVMGPGATLAESLDAVERHVDQAEKQRRRAEKIRDELTRGRSERAQEEDRARVAASELDAWRTDWAPRMARLGLETDALPEQASVFLDRIRDLFELIREIRDFESRIRGIDRDADAFAADVAAVTARLAPELEVGSGPEEPVEALAARVREARDLAERRRLLERRRQELAQWNEASRTAEEAAAALIERRCREAGCDSSEDLLAIASRAQARSRLERDEAACATQLLALGGGATVTAFVEEVRRHDPDGLDPGIAGLDGEIGRLEAELQAVNQTIGAEGLVLEQMDGSAVAADAADRAQASLAQLRDDVAKYARLKLANAVLRRGIERYRERNQDPVLERASLLFARLTTGSFAGLRADFDDTGQTVLKGVRPGGELVGVEGMSDGSHDQLYLALRLASLEHWLAAHEAVPFVVDDILLNFDDARATAALRAFAELSRKTQVLMFTHHEHLVNLAEETLPPDVVFVQRLGSPVRG